MPRPRLALAVAFAVSLALLARAGEPASAEPRFEASLRAGRLLVHVVDASSGARTLVRSRPDGRASLGEEERRAIAAAEAAPARAWLAAKARLARGEPESEAARPDAWLDVAERLERLWERDRDHLGVLRDLLVAYARVLAFERKTELGGRACRLAARRLADFEEAAGDLDEADRALAAELRAAIFAAMEIYPCAARAAASVRPLLRALGQADHEETGSRPLGSIVLRAYRTRGEPPDAEALFELAWWVASPGGSEAPRATIAYVLAERGEGPRRRFYLFCRALGDSTLVAIYGAARPKDEEVAALVERLLLGQIASAAPPPGAAGGAPAPGVEAAAPTPPPPSDEPPSRPAAPPFVLPRAKLVLARLDTKHAELPKPKEKEKEKEKEKPEPPRPGPPKRPPPETPPPAEKPVPRAELKPAPPPAAAAPPPRPAPEAKLDRAGDEIARKIEAASDARVARRLETAKPAAPPPPAAAASPRPAAPPEHRLALDPGPLYRALADAWGAGDPGRKKQGSRLDVLAQIFDAARPGYVEAEALARGPSTDFFGLGRKAGAPRAAPGGGDEKGVRMAFDEDALAAALATAARDGDLLDQLEDRLLAGAPDRALAWAEGEARARILARRKTATVASLASVSLKALAAAAAPFAGRWADLPAESRHPGALRRIHGFVLVAGGDDVVIIGSTAGEGEPVDIDDLVVALRSIWKDGETPFCSLDPDPDDVGGIQKIRLGGVPKDSSFGLVMLDADYVMKQVMAEVKPAGAAGYESLLAHFRREPGAFCSRFWLNPVRPEAGDLQVSPEGDVVLCSAGIQVSSEEMARAAEGLVGMGKTVEIAEKASISFTRSYDAIGRQYEVLRRLRALFDVALLARVLRIALPASPLLERMAALPHRAVAIPEDRYKGHQIAVGERFQLQGGCEMSPAVRWRDRLPLDPADAAALRSRASALATSGSAAGLLAGVSIRVPESLGRRDEEREPPAVLALGLLQAKENDRALAEATRAVREDAADVGAWIVRAQVRLVRGELACARSDARHAWEAAPRERFAVEAGCRILVACALAEGAFDAALPEIDRALEALPESADLHLLRGGVLYLAGKASEARAAMKKAIELAPGDATGYAKLSELEGAQGWPAKAKSLAKKAYALGPRRVDAKVALAMAELGLGNVKAARKLAEDALAEAAGDPESRAKLLPILLTAAVGEERWEEFEARVRDAESLPPLPRAHVLVIAAALAREGGRAERARALFARADEIAPDDPGVRAAKAKLEGGER